MPMPMKSPKKQSSRKAQPPAPRRSDAYRAQGKSVPTQCPECRALFSGGRWSWTKAPAGAEQSRCPACLRIAHNFPAGYVELRGDFLREHRDEILQLVRHTEEREKKLHPLERIIAVEKKRDHTLVTTTGIHNARRIGQALSRAYDGELSIHYLGGDQIVQVRWER